MRKLLSSGRVLAQRLGRLAGTSALVCGLGVLSAPAVADSVTVDTAPLIQQPNVPPNIVLMLDDSGSMAWNFMPDICYLTGTTCDKSGNVTAKFTNSALINAANNGVYYNPKIKYLPPPTATGGSYGDSVTTTFTAAVVNGFTNTTTTVDLTTYAPDSSCGNQSRNYVCSGQYESYDIGSANGSKFSNIGFSHPVTSGKSTYNYFQFSVGDANSTSPKLYYVASDAQGCVSVPTSVTCVKQSDTSGVAAPKDVVAGTNIANWFTYYRTRILMAKSGLMNAFSGLNAKYRVGFGSIDGNTNNNSGNLPSLTYTSGGTTIAQVAPFGVGKLTSAGDPADQKAAFWNWVSKATASGGTPLRVALNSVGTYYQQPQPWTTMSSDVNPDKNKDKELACRQAYTILTTDGFWNESFSGAGNADGTDITKAITGPNGQSYTYKASAPFKDGTSNTLADVAFKYWSTDLRTDTPNQVPTSDDDKAFWQHMVTFTMGLGFTPTGISPAGTTVDQIMAWSNDPNNPPTWASQFSWPVPAGDSINNIADLAHAAVNGHGGFYSATNPSSFTDGLADALKRATARTGSGASLAANSTQLQTGTVAYQATYYTSKWSGDLLAYDIDSTSGAISASAGWKASQQLPGAASRNIYTYNPDSSAYLAFQVSGTTLPSLSTAQLAALGSSASAQADMINYLRGDQSKEKNDSGGVYRKRDVLLGDIVNSQPVYVGAPLANQFLGQSFTGSDTFNTYASGKSSRTGVVYVAANDGFLHGFNATKITSTNTAGGKETYAYLPGAVIQYGSSKGLQDLGSTDYGSDTVPHQFFNDGELAVADVYMSSKWKTVLVGTTGRGQAKAVYALDVTDPANVQFLWERSANDSGADKNSQYIGQMVGKPVIAQTADGTWSVLMGNGYNSAAGQAALLQFALKDGTLSVYTTTDTTGLAAPAVWIGNASKGVSTAAYAGDVNGNVWAFDLSQGSGAGTLLFTAKDSGKKAQPITAGMLMGKSPSGDLWLFFGTGKYLTTADLVDTSTQSWYGLIIGKGANSNSTPITSQDDKTRAKLVQRYITSETSASGTSSGGRTVTTTTEAATMKDLSGWYMDLLQPSVSGSTTTYKAQGERMVTPNQFQNSYLLSVTRIPNSDDPCNPSGTGWVMAVDPFTGTNPQANFFDLNHDGVIDSKDSVNKKPAAGMNFTSLPNNPIFVGSSMLMSFDDGTNSSIKTSGGGNNLTRVSWRELINQ